ncbi:MAG: GCN5-related N-acetyltransferase [Hyphomonadaceae bacterium]|nr:MAG: GCN5-related N-acetyltransferase [Hyphomonadaceae bacterium]KAF0186798.1 MAG: GCN5-related N-acetyltransferase [Hyphomonadaceae bacterium]
MLALLPTTRLKFVFVDDEIKKTLSSNRAKFAKTYGLKVPDDWPLFPEAFEISKENTAKPSATPWGGYLFLDFAGTKIIGNGGYVGTPNAKSEVEIGYEIAPEFQNLGFATEAATEMVSFALCNGATSVIAHTLARENASNSVLKKVGMKFVSEIPNEELGKVWLWKI